MKSLFLYNLEDNEERRLISEIHQAQQEWGGNLKICSTLGLEISDEVRDALIELFVSMSSSSPSSTTTTTEIMKEENHHPRFLTLALGGCKFSSNLDRLLRIANKQLVLEKICFDDARIIHPLVDGMMIYQHNTNLREISFCIGSWRESETSKTLLQSFCQALKSTSATTNLECLRIRTWTYTTGQQQQQTSFYCRNRHNNQGDNDVIISSWNDGLDPILEAIVGIESIQHLQLQILNTFSNQQQESMKRLLCHPNCRIAQLDLRLQKSSSTVSETTTSSSSGYTTAIDDCLIHGITFNIHLKHLHLSGWRITITDARILLDALRSCHNHLEGFKFDRSQLNCDVNHFVTELLRLDFLKKISSYGTISTTQKKSGKYQCLDIDILLPAIIQNNTLESLKLKNMYGVSTATINNLLTQIGRSCPNLKFLKIVNTSKPTTTTTTTTINSNREIKEYFLKQLDCCRHLRQLHLIGFAPFVSKRRRHAFYDDRRTWFYNALHANPELCRFGTGEMYGLKRFLANVDSPLLHLADLNRFGRALIGKSGYHAKIWPLVFEQANDHLDDPERQASVIFGLLSNGCLSRG